MSTTRSRIRRATAALGVTALALGGVLLAATPAYAASTYTVTTTAGDASTGSLVWAIQQANANPGSTVNFSLPLPATITLDAGQAMPGLNSDITIVGPGSSQLTVGDTDHTHNALFAMPFCGSPGITAIVSGIRYSGFGSGGQFACSHIELTDIVFDDSSLIGWSLYVQDSFFRGTDLVVHANAGEPVYLQNIAPNADEMSIVGLEIDGPSPAYPSALGINASGADAKVTIDDVTVTGSPSRGIDVSVAASATVDLSAVTVTGSGTQGVKVDAQTGGSFSLKNATLTDNALDAIAATLSEAHVEITDVDATSTGPSSHGLGLSATNFSDVTIKRVAFHDFDTTNYGGAQLNIQSGSTVDIADSDFRSNTADDGAGLQLAGLNNPGSSLSITGCLFASNVAANSGGGIYLSSVGAPSDVGGVTITRTAIVDNEAGDGGGGVFLFGSTANSDNSDAPVVLIDSSLLSENSARNGGGFLAFYGNSATPGPIGILNTTIDHNTATEYGGGIYAFGSIDAEFDLAYSTLAKNTAGIDGDGARFFGATKVRILGSILAGDGFDLAIAPGGGVALTADWSLVQVPDPYATLALAAGTGNIVGVDPMLAPLANNGGATLTMLPLAGSPVLDVIDPATVDIPAFDQRGIARPSNGKADIGAVELTTLALAATGPEPIAPAVAMVLLLVTGIALIARRKRVHA